MPLRAPPYFVLIERALRDEGTSHHYLPAAKYVALCSDTAERLSQLFTHFPSLQRGGAWTTDAPYRETAEAIQTANAEGVLAVEMEAASLYAFAERSRSLLCALPISPIAWGLARATSRKEKRKEHWRH